jgi:exodeoxyribonuclease V alpha subunit
MTGRVKQKYIEQFGNCPWRDRRSPSYEIECEEFSLIDRLFAQSVDCASEEGRLFLAYLFSASRVGHLCVEINEAGVYPSPIDSNLTPLLIRGAGEIGDGIEGVVEHREGRWYLARYLRAEELVIKRVKSLMQPGAPWESAPSLSCLLPAQRGVIDQALRQPLTLVCGGPGTGKSFTAAELIRAVAAQGKRIAVSAPTGKAVANLRRSLEGLVGIEMKTLHALLGLRSAWDFSQFPRAIGADLVVVDEASMIDIALFAQLLRALKPGSHLVLMGDPDQLPSVEGGSLFADLVDALPASTVRLTHCMRTDLQPIVQLADAIRRGDSARALELLSQEGVVRLRAIESPSELVEALWPPTEERRILTPLRKGAWGCDQLNRQVSARLFAAKEFGSRLSLPIMVTRNDYSLDLFNGEAGRLVAPVASRSVEELVRNPAAVAHFAGRTEPIPAPLLPPCEIAFALSVHKAQGSEFDQVAIAIPPQAEGWGKELLYTAVTRARKSVEILGRPEELARVIPLSTRRHSGIVSQLLTSLSSNLKREM